MRSRPGLSASRFPRAVVGKYEAQWRRRGRPYRDDALDCYTVTKRDIVVVAHETVEKLGTLKAVLIHFDAAEVMIPPLVVAGDVLSTGAPVETAHQTKEAPHFDDKGVAWAW